MSVLANLTRRAMRPIPAFRVTHFGGMIRSPVGLSLRSTPTMVSLSLSASQFRQPTTASFHSSAVRAGAWGYGLFQSDWGLDICDDLEDKSGFPLYSFLDEWEGQEEKARSLLTRRHISSMMNTLDKQDAVYYIAMCIQLGVKIYKKDLERVEKILRLRLRTPTDYPYMQETYGPLLEGIGEYKNDGVTRWDARELGLLVTMSIGNEAARAYRNGEDEDVIIARIEAERAEKDAAKAAAEKAS